MVCSCIITFVLSILKTVLLLLFWLRFLGRHPCVPCWPCPRSAGGLVLHTWLAPQAWLSLLGFDAALYKVSGQRSLCPHVAHISVSSEAKPAGCGPAGCGPSCCLSHHAPVQAGVFLSRSREETARWHRGSSSFDLKLTASFQGMVSVSRVTTVLKAWKNDVSCSLWGLGLVYCDWIREPNEYRFAAEHKHNFMFSDAHILVR